MSALYLTADDFTPRHGFFTRRGGVSDGIFGSLNCGYGSNDNAEKVRENRTRVEQAMGGALTTQYQVHGVAVTTLTQPIAHGEAPQADAMVTDRPGVLLGILTADCAPILFSDAKAKVIGAAHAGWKGAFGNIAGETVKTMEALGAHRGDIMAVVGPCIAQASYEVDSAFRERFLAQDQQHARFFIASVKPGHFMFDLKGYVRQTLEQAGVGAVNCLANDTCFEEDDFFSYRRTTLRGEPAYGRQLSVIMLED